MINLKKTAFVPAMAALALAALVGSGVSASAQNAYTNGPDGAQPNSLGGSRPHNVRRHGYRSAYRDYGSRPLTVSRQYPVAPPVYLPPPYSPYSGPGAIVTAPLGVASTIVSVPFRILGSIFPAEGSPLAIVGAPVQFAGRVAQAPFQIAEVPFGGPGPFSAYPAY